MALSNRKRSILPSLYDDTNDSVIERREEINNDEMEDEYDDEIDTQESDEMDTEETDEEEDEMDKQLIEQKQPIENILLQEISVLYKDINEFKNSLYKLIVSKPKEQYDPSNINAMVVYNSLFLKSIAYWMSYLYTNQKNTQDCKPDLKEYPKLDSLFEKITEKIKTYANYKDRDAVQLVYGILFKNSTNDPFTLNN